jgi:hypothetical protein
VAQRQLCANGWNVIGLNDCVVREPVGQIIGKGSRLYRITCERPGPEPVSLYYPCMNRLAHNHSFCTMSPHRLDGENRWESAFNYPHLV